MSDHLVASDRRALVAEQTLAWLATHRWLDGCCTARQVEKWRFVDFALLWFPRGALHTVVQASLWCHLISVLDDVCEEDAAAIPSLAAAVRAPSAPAAGLARCLAEAWRDLAALISAGDPGWREYLEQSFAELLEAYVWEHGWRRRGGFPPADEYDHWRWLSGGVKVYGVLLAQQAGLAAETLLQPQVSALVQAAGTLACMANDRPSAAWDAAHGNPINAALIAQQHGDGALDAWIERWQAQLAAAAPNEFTGSLAHFVSGTARWMELTGRYSPAG